ncbi:MAG TPA: hypothetical protein VI758_09135, partial [Bacteroidota bacterium]
MKTTILCIALLLCLEPGRAQVVTTAVPFLGFVPSPEANGMGGISSCRTTCDPFAMTLNPAQLGLQSLSQNFGAGLFAPKTQWIPSFGISDLTYRADVISAGLRIDDYLGVPFPLSVGLGYSFVEFDLGTFYRTIFDPTAVGTYHPVDRSTGYTLGVGFDYGIRFGIGVTMKKIRSASLVFGTLMNDTMGTANGTAYDYGALATIPFGSLIPGAKTLIPDVEPNLDLSIGLGRSNVGNAISYIDPAQADPLPRSAYVGLALEASVVTHHFGNDWKLVSVCIARQANNLLVTQDYYPGSGYLGGFGHIDVIKNVFGGRGTHDVDARKGFQADLLELFTYRRGSFDEPGYGFIHTSGFSIRLGGMLKLLEAIGVLQA